MNTTSCCSHKTRLIAGFIGVLGCFLVMAGLIRVLFDATLPAPLGEDRVELRRKNLKELRDAEAEILNLYTWRDQGKGIVRLPIHRAMELTLKEWQNSLAARSNLIARVEIATALPPKPPEEPSPFE